MPEILDEINKLYSYLNYLSLKPEFGGSPNSAPEERRIICDEIKNLEDHLQDAFPINQR